MNASVEKYDGLLFDADNHYYEAEDAFTRYVPKRMQKRCVEWVEMKDGKKFHLVAGKLNKSVGNPTFNAKYYSLYFRLIHVCKILLTFFYAQIHD